MQNVKILGATLLSKEEVETLLTQQERACKNWWWLRSPGYESYCAAIVLIGGVSDYGLSVNDDRGCVRPALKIDISNSDIKIGDTFTFREKVFKVISPELAWMYKDDIGRCVFRKDWKAPDANIYEASDVKKFIDNWFASASLGKKLKTVYYGHHQYKYGTPVEAYELKTIQKYFADDITVINPAIDIIQGRAEEEIMTDCLNAVKSCDALVFSSMCGVIGKGLYTEIKTALDNGIPVYEIYGNTLNPADNITFKLLHSDTPREYAVYKVFKGGPA